jgi:hypothetical protein
MRSSGVGSEPCHDADDCGAAAAYLLSDDAQNVTGTTLYVDAGYHAMGMEMGLLAGESGGRLDERQPDGIHADRASRRAVTYAPRVFACAERERLNHETNVLRDARLDYLEVRQARHPSEAARRRTVTSDSAHGIPRSSIPQAAASQLSGAD